MRSIRSLTFLIGSVFTMLLAFANALAAQTTPDGCTYPCDYRTVFGYCDEWPYTSTIPCIHTDCVCCDDIAVLCRECDSAFVCSPPPGWDGGWPTCGDYQPRYPCVGQDYDEFSQAEAREEDDGGSHVRGAATIVENAAQSVWKHIKGPLKNKP
jgi:hypothetical protein